MPSDRHTIRKIENLGEGEVFDLTEPKTQQYLTDYGYGEELKGWLKNGYKTARGNAIHSKNNGIVGSDGRTGSSIGYYNNANPRHVREEYIHALQAAWGLEYGGKTTAEEKSLIEAQAKQLVPMLEAVNFAGIRAELNAKKAAMTPAKKTIAKRAKKYRI